MNNQDIVNQIRQKIDIVDLISEYIPLVQKGKNYFGVCPFHNDTNPSMSVSREKQIYKCFSCGASGNVFNFIMDYDHIDFKEAIKVLGEKAGIEVSGITVAPKTTKFDKYYDMYEIANKYYQNNINTKEGQKAKEYLEKRHIDENLIKEFGIGLSLDNMNALTTILSSKDYSIKELDNLGLASNNHDAYINRIMFPLHDISGRVVGFSGRIYDNSNLNKYLNTKETIIFKKGECLYNYHIARDHARKLKYVIIVEGFMDAIRLSQIGYKNVIALMGTAMTSEQMHLVKKLSTNVYLSLDGDNPGQNATLNIGEELTKLGLNVKVIGMPTEKAEHDPDEFIIKYGKESFDNLVESALNYSDFKINFLKKGVNFNSDLELSNYINSVIKEVSNIKDEIRREIILKKLAIETNLSYNTLEKRLNEYLEFQKVVAKEETPKVEVQDKKTTKITKYEKAAYALIYGMVNDPWVIRKFEKEDVRLLTKELRYLASEICYYYRKYGTINMADFYTYLTDKEELLVVYNFITNLDYEEEVSVKAIEDYITVINEYNMRQEIKRLSDLVKKENDPIEKAKIAEKIRLLRIGE
ncbi:MAG: DNA primase [Firmicutes bacterium]|nr:DNA primase [Bacillota bacterium]